MKITIDSRECGAGKTHGVNGTIHQIKNAISLGYKALVCVPSINLSYEYQKAFPSSRVIVSDEVSDTVQNRLIDSLFDQVEVIIITHQAFIMSDIPYSFRLNYKLIIDEAFDPYRMLEFTRKTTDKVFDWKNYFSDIQLIDSEHFVKVSFIDLITNSETARSELFRGLSSRNWNTYIGNDIITSDDIILKDRISFIQELSGDIMKQWSSVHIAAAHFDYTFMSWWLNKNELNYKIIANATPHNKKVVFHIPDYTLIKTKNKDGKFGDFTWSKYKQQSMNWLLDQYHSYVNKIVKNEDVLRLKNNYIQEKNDVYVNSHKVNHNASGMNQYSHIRNVSLESCMNPNKEFGYFLDEMSYYSSHKDVEKSTLVFWAKTGYIHYQILMRCYLRTNEWNDEDEVNVFLIDERDFKLFYLLFDNFDYKEWKPLIPSDISLKQPPLSDKEKERAKYLRKKYTNDAQMETRELIAKYEKTKPLTAIQRVQKQREIERQQLNQLIQLIK